MKRLFAILLFTTAATVAGIVGYGMGSGDIASPQWTAFVRSQITALAKPQLAVEAAKPAGPIIYYRHPDGLPLYSATLRQTDDGRAFMPVLASEDVRFDPPADAYSDAESDPITANNHSPKNGSADRTILYYRNPMGLADTSPVPKKDSMGMDYLPVYSEDAADASTVSVSPGKLQRTGVKTDLATKVQIKTIVNVPGVLTLDERRISVVSTRTEAFIESVEDVTTGAPVKQGQPLVRLYAKEVASAAALYAVDVKGGVKTAASGSLQRLKNLGAPSQMISEIAKTGRVPLSMTLDAPQDGIVLERTATPGTMAAAGQLLFRIADLSIVWVVADVPEYLLSGIKVGSESRVRVRSLTGQSFPGKISLIYPELRGETRTARARIEIANPHGVLLPGMFAEVLIESATPDPVVAVPDSALIDSGDRQVVIVDLGDGKFQPRDVKVGARGGNMVEMMEGISEGDRVVIAANFLIDAESNLKAALSALSPAEAKP